MLYYYFKPSVVASLLCNNTLVTKLTTRITRALQVIFQIKGHQIKMKKFTLPLLGLQRHNCLPFMLRGNMHLCMMMCSTNI